MCVHIQDRILVGSIWHDSSYSSFSESLRADIKYAIICENTHNNNNDNGIYMIIGFRSLHPVVAQT